MSGNQLSPPDKDRDEPVVVQQFIEVPQEHSSAVQVSLAKRIVTPTSSKVLCMAARTSVPVADEETASVSDLALKLADGTNVVVSLSYFNDTTVQNVLPLTRNIYDPNRYTVGSDSSSLGKVFFTIVMAAVAGFFCLANKPTNIFYPYLHWNYGNLANLGSSATQVDKTTGNVVAKDSAPEKHSKPGSKDKSPEIAKTKTTSPGPITFVGPPPSKHSASPAVLTSHAPRVQRVSRRAASSTVRSKAPRSYSSSADRESMLVPPPPPVMMLNTQPDPNMMRYIPELMMAPQAVFPKAAAPKQSKQAHLPPPPDSVTSFIQSAPAAPGQFQNPPAADPVSLMQQQEVVMKPARPHIKRVEIMSAPVPGEDPNYPQMERIQVPAPDSASL